MGRGGAAGKHRRPTGGEASLIGSTGLSVRLAGSRGLVLHQKGFDPVVMALLQDPIRDGSGLLRHLEALAERLGEALQHRPGQTAQGAEDLADDGRVERGEAGVDAGAWRY